MKLSEKKGNLFCSVIDLEVEIAEQAVITLRRMPAIGNNHNDYKPFQEAQLS